METTDYLLLITRWLHISAAIVAIGGAFFTRVVLMPAAASTLDDPTHAKLREALRARWARIVQTCIALLLVTGGFNFVMLAMPPKVEPMPYHAIFGFKFLAAMGVFFIASVLVGRGQGLAAMRTNRAKWLTVLLVLAGIIVALSGVLHRIRTTQGPHVSLQHPSFQMPLQVLRTVKNSHDHDRFGLDSVRDEVRVHQPKTIAATG